MAGLRSWTPNPAEPQPHDWWRPLISFGRRVRLDGGIWPVHIDEFELVGGVDRDKRPSLFLYRHHRSHGEVIVDAEGNAYRWIPASRGRSAGRYVAEPDLTRAVWAAGLPHAVEPWPEHREDPRDRDHGWEPPHERSMRDRRPQLTLLQGGDVAAGEEDDA